MGQSVRPLSCTKTMYAFQERPENFSGWLAPCPGSAAAQEMQQAEFSKRMHPRNGVEGTHSELVRGHAMRRTKYRGLSRVRLSHYFMGAACNVKRYLNLLAFQIKTAAPSPA